MLSKNKAQISKISSFLEADEFYDSSFITLSNISLEEEKLDFILSLKSDSDETELKFKLNFIGVRDIRLSTLKSYFDLGLFEDHPVLWQFNDDQAHLHFSGENTNPKEVICDLLQKHLEVSGTYIPFTKYLNPSLPVFELLKNSTGELALGPIRLLEAYRDILLKHSYKASINSKFKSTDWNPETNEFEDYPELNFLGFDGEDYVLFEEVEVQQL